MTESKKTYAAPPGFNDILPEEVRAWQRLEATAREIFRRYHYREIRTPLMEATELFTRSIGETTDIVEKEMFTFGEGEDSLTLRPEGTAPAVRAYVEHQYQKREPFQKLFYVGPSFRRERPQKGRYRQFHQIGAEAIGSADPLLDAETMMAALELLRAFGVEGAVLHVNSIGCPECRKEMRRALSEYFEARKAALCRNCNARMARNIFRVLDCKEAPCRGVCQTSPDVTASLCEGCRSFHGAVKKALQENGVPFQEDRFLVRGFDYYTRTVFEIKHASLGAQDTLCGGGRYDNLVEELGGAPAPCVGFGMGMERVLLVAAQGHGTEPETGVYVAAISENERAAAFGLLRRIRAAGVPAEMDFERRSFKAQMRTANRLGARFAVILGENEVKSGAATVKDLARGAQETVAMEKTAEYLKNGLAAGTPDTGIFTTERTEDTEK